MQMVRAPGSPPYWLALQPCKSSLLICCVTASITHKASLHFKALPTWFCPTPPQTEHMNAGHWRKSSQFIGLTRSHVAAVLNDTEVYRS